MKKLYVLFCLLASLSSKAQLPDFEWVNLLQGANKTGMSDGNSIGSDAAGNIYIAGHFSGSVDFDPGPGTMTHTSALYRDNSFIQKVNASGNPVWTRFIDCTSDLLTTSIAVDAAGNSFVTGFYNGTADFDPGAGIDTITALSARDLFILRLDAAGNFVFVKTMHGTSADEVYGQSITIDTHDTIYLAGEVVGTVDLDPGPSSYLMTVPGSNPSMFVSKLDPMGNFIWSKCPQSVTSVVNAASITLDAASNVITTGFLMGSGDFDPGSGTSYIGGAPSSGHLFLQKLDSNGNFVWVKELSNGNGSMPSVRTDAAGNIYATGHFSGSHDFDPGAGVFTLSASAAPTTAIYVLKLDAAGNFVWALSPTGGNSDASSLTLDATGHIYITGSFGDTVDFDAGSGSYPLTATGTFFDGFVLKLNAVTGNFEWVASIDGSYQTRGYSILVNGGSIYTFGVFRGTTDFDPGSAVTSATSIGIEDIFLLKLQKSTSNGVPDNEKENMIAVYPNPAGNVLTVANLTKPAVISIYDITGRLIQSQKTNGTSFQLDLQDEAKGIYFVRIASESGNVVKKIVKQ